MATSMKHNIPITIDTSELAREIDSVSSKVDQATTAVNTMNAAIVLAEKNAADKVCADVNQGFYTMLISQVTQKIAQQQSAANAHLLTLNQLKRRLISIQQRMERDYQRLVGRYQKLFTGLNQSLEQRIVTLDRPTMDFVSRDIAQSMNRINQLVSIAPTAQSEGITLGQKIVASNLKARAAMTINAMSSYLLEQERQDKALNRVMHTNQVENLKKSTIHLPVLCYESIGNSTGIVHWQAVTNSTGLSNTVANTLKSHSLELTREENGLQLLNLKDEELRTAYMTLGEQPGISPRVRAYMQQLYEGSSTLK